jgi:predicted ArsR family transcriptional regulator
MSRYEATVEIESETDAHAVRLFAEHAYDTFREELQHPDRDDASVNETLQTLEAIREATRHPSPGSLTLVYERHDDTFDD